MKTAYALAGLLLPFVVASIAMLLEDRISENVGRGMLLFAIMLGAVFIWQSCSLAKFHPAVSTVVTLGYVGAVLFAMIFYMLAFVGFVYGRWL